MNCYKNLSDAPVLAALANVENARPFQIFYRSCERLAPQGRMTEIQQDLAEGVKVARKRGHLDDIPTLLKAQYIELGTLHGRTPLHQICHLMQGEMWSPQGEARELIRAKGLQHTSMSVGDIIVRPVDGGEREVFMVDRFGFEMIGTL
ncbi:hypothetical protein [Ferrimonas marina]|uniref:Uncharacterized protein n=1 Tax=Ferrimonas marina TaxID=299255 RepID=A0A1M5TNY7_9GAMM|nr:hypothetical protein [Ferrimonas marina]SHH52525.1 hypothetical protein SAMN02745129_2224 [Ferrimonas marina]